RRLLDAVDEIAVLSVDDLHSDPAAPSAHNRTALPEPFAHCQSEPFAQRLLDNDVGGALKRVDLHGTDLLDVRQEVDVRIAAPWWVGQLPVVEAFGIVGCHRSRQYELGGRELVTHDS